MKKTLLLFCLSVLLSIEVGTAKALWDSYRASIITNINIGNTSVYNITKDTSIENDLNQLGIIPSDNIDALGAFLLKDKTQYNLILYFSGLPSFDCDIFDISINNYPYSLNYIGNIDSALLSKGYYYTSKHDPKNYYKKIYIQNVGNIDSLIVKGIDYYYWEDIDDENSLLLDDYVDINKTINVIKGF